VLFRSCTARKDHVEYVLDLWRTHPSVEILTITANIRRELQMHRERTGVGAARLLGQSLSPPEGLTAAIVVNWFDGRTLSADKDHLEFVLAAYQTLPFMPTTRVSITAGIRRELRALEKQSGLGPSAMLRGANNRPQGLTSVAVRSWMSGLAKSALKAHLEFVLSYWPDVDPIIPLTNTIRAELRKHRVRTGVSADALMRGDQNAPKGLSSATIYRWINGDIRRVRSVHLEYVRSKWARLPDNSRPPRKLNGRAHTSYAKHSGEPARIDITPQIRAQLRCEHERAGVGPYTLLRRSVGVPEGLKGHAIAGWLSGQTATANSEYLDFVLDLWRAQPSLPAKAEPRVPIDAAVRGSLHAERNRTGVGTTLMFDGTKYRPDGLNAYMIRSWISGQTKTARRDHLEFVLKAWGALPDK